MITEQKIREWLSLSNQNEAARHEMLSLFEFCKDNPELRISQQILDSGTVEVALRTLKKYVQDVLITISNGDYSTDTMPAVREGANAFKGIHLTPVQAINLFMYEHNMVSKARRLQKLLNQRGKIEYEQGTFIANLAIKEVIEVRQNYPLANILVTPRGYSYKGEELYQFAKPLGEAMSFLYEHQARKVSTLLRDNFSVFSGAERRTYVIV